MEYEFKVNIQPKEDTSVLFVRLPKTLANELTCVAKSEGQTKNHVMTKIVQEFVANYQRKRLAF